MNKIIKLSLISLLVMTCGNDYIISTNPNFVIKDTNSIVEDEQTRVVVEYFIQPDKPENLDVLFVIDTSCSMADNYENVSIGLDILRDDIEELTYDYQIAMINSSLKEPYFVGPFDTDSNSIEIFMAPYSLAKDRYEEGFGSLYLFTLTPEGIEFLRPDVDKLYIFVSDEPEQSTIPVSMFIEWMNEYHSEVNHDAIVISVNEQSPENCRIFYTIEEGEEDRFLTFSNYYNKMITDICGDFQLALADTSFLLTPIAYKLLKEKPVEDSIVVYKNGEQQAEWYYLENTNTIYFEFELQPSSIVEIGYESYL